MPTNATDHIRWIDTEVMLADPMTKSMEADKLVEFLATNQWDTSQPIESVMKKQAKQNARRKAMATEERIDHGTARFKLPKDNGPLSLIQIVRRVTKDLSTGAVIDDDHKVQTRDTKYLTREVPNAPRDVRTIFYYPKEKSDEGLVPIEGKPIDDQPDQALIVSTGPINVADAIGGVAVSRGDTPIHIRNSKESRV